MDPGRRVPYPCLRFFRPPHNRAAPFLPFLSANRSVIVLTQRLFPITLLLLLATLLLGGWTHLAHAQAPRLLHYQATLTDGAIPVENPVNIEVSFFAQREGGPPIDGWSENYADVALEQGRLQLLLGSQTSLPDALLEVPELYLQITADGNVFPRLRVASTAFALRAEVAEAVAPGGVGSGALADEIVTTAVLEDRAVTEDKLESGAVTTRVLTDGAVTTAKIAPQSVGTVQLAPGAVTSNQLGASAVTSNSLVNGAVTTEKLENGAVTASKVQRGELVTALNGLQDAIELVAGDNVSIRTDAQDGTITIEAEEGERSSRRWKSDIVPLDDALGLVQQLRGVRYRWTESGTPDLGFIAEEVGAVIPEVVKYAPNGVDAETVNYARLVALLVEAIKEQQAQMAADRIQLQEIQARLEALEARRSTP